MTEAGLIGGVSYTRYVWAYNACGESVSIVMVQTTEPPIMPTVETSPVTGVGLTTAESGGNVTDDGGAPVTERGVCWSTSPNPVSSGSHITGGTGTGAFMGSVSGLVEGTVYYLRAYATNVAGTSYGSEISFSTSVADVDGNIYKTVRIGTQLWITENLKVTKYNDGTGIPYVTDNASWGSLTTPGYCWYNNDEGNKAIYGTLYNFYAASTVNLCPTGWHVPTDDEWTTLSDYLGGRTIAGGKLKEAGTAHWNSPNTGATNETGFTALPAGYRMPGGAFSSMGASNIIWSSSVYDTYGRDRVIYSYWSIMDPSYTYFTVGASVRCIKNQ